MLSFRIQNYSYKIDKLLLFSLIILYILTRIFNLTLLPIFNDEAIHIYWAKLIASSNKQWFISLIDGEPPLFIWSIVVFLKLLPSTWYLIAGRLPSVLAGLVGLLGIYQLANALFFSKRVAFLSGIFFTISPFFLFYDRLASYDSLLSALGVWSIYFAVKSAQELHIKYFLLWGVVLGLTLLSKASGIIFLFLSIITFFTFFLKEGQRKKVKHIIYIVFTIILAEGLHGLLFFSHGYHLYTSTGISRYTIPISVLLQNPFIVFPRNVHSFYLWIFSYYTWPVLLVGVIGSLYLFFTKQSHILLLLFLWLFPVLVVLVTGIDPYPRHILFTTPYFFLILAVFIRHIYRLKKFLVIALFLAMCILPLYFAILLLFNPPAASLPAVDKNQYITGVPSGYGLEKVFTFLQKTSAKKHITVITLGTVSLFPYAFNLEFWNNPNVTIIPLWPVTKNTRQEIIRLSKVTPVYVVLKYNTYQQHKNFMQELGLQKKLQSDRPDTKTSILLAVPKQ
ncbi:MAG TPA: glycosyltransferase family 39 protein [Candidatus Saccharimonadales bacterium]|nr:glycosyltransferase family 39 protein [Candidatus Saccharimonadales bacterium]